MTILLPVLAQIPIPVKPGTLDIISYVTKALDALVDPTSTVFLATAQPLLNKLGLLALVIGALTWTYGYLTGNHIFSGEHFWRVLIRYLIAYNLLRYYNAPMPLVGYSFHQIFTQEARWMAAQIDISVLDRFLTQIQQIWGTMEKPHPWDIPATLIYIWIGLNMAAIECGLFAIIAFSFWAIGVGLILGALLHRGVSVPWHQPLLLGLGELHDQVLALPGGGVRARRGLYQCHSQLPEQHGSWRLQPGALVGARHFPDGGGSGWFVRLPQGFATGE